MSQQKPSQTSNLISQPKSSSSNSNSSDKLPPLKQLKARPDDVRDWAQHPVTRLWFRNVGDTLEAYKENIFKIYDRDNADASYSRFAEIVGAINALADILNAKDDDGILIAREEDLKEILYNDELDQEVKQ